MQARHKTTDSARTRQLTDGLTTDQLAELVLRLLERMSSTERAEFYDSLAPDVAAVLRGRSDPPTAPPAAKAKDAGGRTSDAKFAAQFHAVLGALRDVVAEVGDEEGAYLVQEYEWEPPDFGAAQLGEDIERCAEDLLPLLDRAAALKLEDEGLFLDLCREISDGIAQYPEHIYTDDGVELGRAGTECVLTWLDRHAKTEADFLQRLVDFLDGAGCVGLDHDAIRAYLLEGWPGARRRALYRAIADRRVDDAGFCEATDTPRTLWYDLHYTLAVAFDAAVGIAIAEASVRDDWTKGVELVDAAVADGNAVRALEFCRKTVDAYYRYRSFGREAADFDPATTPLFSHWGASDELLTVSRLLGVWAELSAQTGDRGLAGLVAIQQALFTDADDWDVVRAAFARAGTADTSALFGAWKGRVLGQQHGILVCGMSCEAPVWPEWLIDAGFATDFEGFTSKAVAWLSERIGTEKDRAHGGFGLSLGHVWPPQMSLVAELFADAPSAEASRALRTVLLAHCRLNPCPARLAWLRRTDMARLTTAGLGFVRANMARLIPSPVVMGGDYEAAAGWLAAAREVAPGVATSTLQRWQTDYGRRRNLWRDLRQHGFEV